MANPATFKFDRREFDATLKRYRPLTQKDPAKICNTKAFFITRGATRETPKADRAKIEAELGKYIVTPGVSKKGKPTKKRSIELVASNKGPPLAALIVQKRRAAKGLKGLHGPEMKAAIKKFLGNTFRSIAFLKSGWLPAIKALAPLADRRSAPPTGPMPKQIGQAKGSAKPASESVWKAVATFTNSAGANENNRGALIKYGAPALQRAVDAETASMKEYIERKYRETAQKAGIRTN